MSAARPAALVFDLDGTLVDSRADLAAAIDALRAELGLVALGEAAAVRLVGEGARRLVARAIDRPEAAVEAELARFLALYEARFADRTRPYPGIDQLLARAEPSYPLALLTNKPERFAHLLLAHFGWSARFRVVIGGDTLPRRKPDPLGLHEIAARLGVAVAELLLVGDSWIDEATARAAGCRFALAEWGFPAAEERAAIPGRERYPSAAALAAALAL